LFDAFEGLFRGKIYKHRDSTQGDRVAVHLFEDLLHIARSPRYLAAVMDRQDRAVNAQNRRRGIRARRGDGTFGQIIPGEAPSFDPGYSVGRGAIATVEIGIEVKILFKAMIKQIDRVINDLENQVRQFRRGGGNPITVGIVGVNHAESCISYEGTREFPTTGKAGFPHPTQESAEAEHSLELDAKPHFDELLLLRFKATNAPPYPFEWVDLPSLRLDYGAALARISREYERRF
jgi:hypothetical protein